MKRWILALLLPLCCFAVHAETIQFRGAGAITSVDSLGTYFPGAAIGDGFYFDYTLTLPEPDSGGRYDLSRLSLTLDGNTVEVLPGTFGNNSAYIELIEYQFFGPSGTTYRDSFALDAYSATGQEALSVILWSDLDSPVPSNFLVGNHHPPTALDLSLAANNIFDYRSVLGDSFHGRLTSLAPVPLPAAAWLLFPALVALSRRRATADQVARGV